jgi:hypothetical protein
MGHLDSTSGAGLRARRKPRRRAETPVPLKGRSMRMIENRKVVVVMPA